MNTGTVVSNRLQSKTIVGIPPKVFAHRYNFYCDAGCKPNAGTQFPAVWDGRHFLPIKRRPGTNHRGVYDAVATALAYARARRARSVQITTPSKLIYDQLVGTFCAAMPHWRRRGISVWRGHSSFRPSPSH
jgi:ribonuclease HI